MQGAAFRALGLPAVYVALRPTAEGLADVMQALARTGGGGNVTVPFKPEAAAAAEGRTSRVERLGAANTFWAVDGRLHADNTDVDGVLAALDALDAGHEGPWLVLGTGGSARAVAAAAAERGVALAVRSRDAGRASRFAAWAVTLGVTVADAADARVAINATPLGLQEHDPLPLAPAGLPRLGVALDLVYARGGTRWMHVMRDAGVRAADGRTMLLGQGVAAFRRWFPRLEPPVEIMRSALRESLGGWV
jgi:shikimate dehydrogenase